MADSINLGDDANAQMALQVFNERIDALRDIVNEAVYGFVTDAIAAEAAGAAPAAG